MISTAIDNLDEALSTARKLVAAQQYNDAEQVCLGVLTQRPDHLAAITVLSHALYAQAKPEAAIPLMERAVALAPQVAKYHSNLGFLRGVCGDDDGAVSAHERALALEPSLVSARINLAQAYRVQKRYAQARDMYKSVLARDPSHVASWQSLADVQVGCDEHDDAIASLKQVLTLEPENMLARQQLVIVYRALGRNDELAALYRAWIAEDPDGTPVAQHMLAACTGEGVPARASDRCIERLFDQDAAEFESHLVGALGYRAPDLCAEAFARHAPEPSKAWSIVDAGCGTGLCGPLFEPWAGELEGVDLSGGMLEQADAKQVYSRLHRGELTAFLTDASERWNAVVCADTFCYFGELESPLRAAYGALRAGGLIVFTVEAQGDAAAAYVLQNHGRYTHTRDYLERALADSGFAVRELTEATLRFERGDAVRGFVVVASKSPAVVEPTAVVFDPDAELELALECLRKHELLAAEHVCEGILARHPDHVETLNAMSMIELARDNADAAIRYIKRAIVLAPDTAGFHVNLGHLHAGSGDLAAAISAYEQAAALEPTHIAHLTSLADVCVDREDFESAIAALKRAIVHEPRNLAIRGYLAHLYRRLGQRDNLADHYRSWIAENPGGSAVARHNLAAVTGEDIPARASDRYVQQLFDSCADDFDDRLIDKLGYRAPALCKEAFAQHMPAPQGALNIIDLGCGTGLCGPLFAPWARALEGVDLSERMLEHARAREVYTNLHTAELTSFIEAHQARWDAAICSDTFCYFGDLEAPLRATYDALAPGGTFVFTVEAAADSVTSAFALQESGRYTHTPQHVEHALASAGYKVLALSEQTLRFENKQPVQGYVVVARKAARR